MDRIINSNTEKQTIYEIYRACRLCGAGAGYKMPIIQNVVDLDASGIELTQKIRDCVQIEVHPDDKMPPLICELCVDKVNDFYEFVELCQRTNKRTRMRLGLPPQNPSRVPSSDASSNSGDCILGVTEPVYQNDDSDEPLAPVTRRSKQPEVKKVKMPAGRRMASVKMNRTGSVSQEINRRRCINCSLAVPRNTSIHTVESVHNKIREVLNSWVNGTPTLKVVSSKQKRPPTPPRSSRAKGSSEDTISLSSLKQQQAKKSSVKVETPQPKSILKKSKEREVEKPKVKREETPPPVRSKRSREAAKPEVPQKKVKLSVPVKPPEFACVVCALSLRSNQALTSHVRCHTVQYTNPELSVPVKPPESACVVCALSLRSNQALTSHVRCHTVQYTSPELACNACSEWFSTPEEVVNHHTQHRVKHRPYRCRRCRGRYSSAHRYTEHIATSKCVPWPEVPDKKCPSCWRLFPTGNLLRLHHCGGEDNRPGGKCSNCKRVYSLLKNQKKHEAICLSKKKGSSEIKVDPDVKARIKPVQVRITRCDGLLETQNDVSRVPKNYGLDRRCVYPYLSTVKSQLCLDSMVSIKTELDDIEDEEFVHWDSSSDSEGKTTVDSLTTLSLKKIFSRKCLGKVARKRRKVKLEFEGTMKRDIENIINNFDNEDSWDNGNNGSDEESLLTNYVPFDEPVSNRKADVEDSNDSQSILDLNAGAKNDENSKTEAVSDAVRVDKNSERSGIETDENINKEGLNNRERLDKDSEESARETEDKINEDVGTEDGLSNRVSDKDSECGTETADKVNSELENSEKDVTEISRVSVIRENNDSRSNDVDTDSTGISNDNDAKTENNTEVSNDDSRESNNDKSNNDNRTETIADFNHVDSVENKPEERTNTDNVDLDNENSNNDCKDDINNSNNSSTVDNKNDNSMEDDTNDSTLNNDSGNTNNDQENTNDYENTNNDNENTNNDHEDTSNDHENTINDHENTNNDHENTNNDNENTINDNERVSDTISAKTNGEVEEKSDKLSFGDMDDISDTEVDDKKLMDDLNEHIGEDNKNNDESNQNNDLDKQNGANNDVTNACEDRENLTDHERAINDLISENNDKSNYNHVADSNDKVTGNNDVNDYEADKISLEDLLPPKSDAKSMDLDSISDDEFDFDAC
ncbi:uncharacterized protein LOC135085175 [Ostrinia nubilalis]|uniref:uncharacterized protein LOC135085175 n=1 Tax=Ostrinia nubilalis TaxID=29057 RepID=UPI003082302B